MGRTLGKTHIKKGFFLVVGPLRFYPPYTNGLVVHAGCQKKRFFFAQWSGGFTLPTPLVVRPLKKPFFYVYLPLRSYNKTKNQSVNPLLVPGIFDQLDYLLLRLGEHINSKKGRVIRRQVDTPPPHHRTTKKGQYIKQIPRLHKDGLLTGLCF